MTESYESKSAGLSDPAVNAVAVTPNDAADLGVRTRGLFVGGTGDLKVDMLGTGVVFVAVPAGTLLPFRVKRVYATLTTATSIVALY